jgi:hypothetical protein
LTSKPKSTFKISSFLALTHDLPIEIGTVAKSKAYDHPKIVVKLDPHLRFVQRLSDLVKFKRFIAKSKLQLVRKSDGGLYGNEPNDRINHIELTDEIVLTYYTTNQEQNANTSFLARRLRLLE